jgi:predicted PilT family ATPase
LTPIRVRGPLRLDRGVVGVRRFTRFVAMDGAVVLVMLVVVVMVGVPVLVRMSDAIEMFVDMKMAGIGIVRVFHGRPFDAKLQQS